MTFAVSVLAFFAGYLVGKFGRLPATRFFKSKAPLGDVIVTREFEKNKGQGYDPNDINN